MKLAASHGGWRKKMAASGDLDRKSGGARRHGGISVALRCCCTHCAFLTCAARCCCTALLHSTAYAHKYVTNLGETPTAAHQHGGACGKWQRSAAKRRRIIDGTRAARNRHHGQKRRSKQRQQQQNQTSALAAARALRIAASLQRAAPHAAASLTRRVPPREQHLRAVKLRRDRMALRLRAGVLRSTARSADDLRVFSILFCSVQAYIITYLPWRRKA